MGTENDTKVGVYILLNCSIGEAKVSQTLKAHQGWYTLETGDETYGLISRAETQSLPNLKWEDFLLLLFFN